MQENWSTTLKYRKKGINRGAVSQEDTHFLLFVNIDAFIMDKFSYQVLSLWFNFYLFFWYFMDFRLYL